MPAACGSSGSRRLAGGGRSSTTVTTAPSGRPTPRPPSRSTPVGAPEDLGAAGSPFSLRAPAVAPDGPRTVLVFRSSESLRYTSAIYGATETVDPRYSGSGTIDTRNAAQLALRGTFDDIQTYV